MALIPLLSNFLDRLYEYDWARKAKDYLRPIKHWIFGKGDVYLIVENINKTRKRNNPVRIVFDVGAAVGDKSLLFAKTFPEAVIYCFEPQRESLERLQRRTKAFQSRLRPINSALFNDNGQKELHVLSYRDASNLLSSPRLDVHELRKEAVVICTLDAFVKKHNIDHIDLIKIDVEGAEKEVLEGGKETFAKIVDNVFLEIMPWRNGPRTQLHIDIFQIMHGWGFEFIGVYGDYFFSKDKDLLRAYQENIKRLYP